MVKSGEPLHSSRGLLSCLPIVFVLVLRFTRECTASLDVRYPASCDFETEDMCGWVQGEGDDFDWRRRSGQTPSRNTGPDHDHTIGENGTGHYMYIEGTGVHAWNSAHLNSPSLAPLPAYCVTFFYHMYGEDTGELTLRVLDEARPDTSPITIWTMLWEQGNVWLNASVDAPCDGGCKLSFEAKPGNGYWSDSAIDDVTVVNGSCFPPGKETTLAPTQYATTIPQATTRRVTTTGGMQTPATTTLDYTIIEYMYDQHFITIILAVGLTFWTIIFGIIFIVFCYCDKRQRGHQPGSNYDRDIDSPHPEKQAKHAAATPPTYVEIDEQERVPADSDNGEEDAMMEVKPSRTETGDSEGSSVDSERYSVPVIIPKTKPFRGPSPPPSGYMELDSLNNNSAPEYQPLNATELTAVEA